MEQIEKQLIVEREQQKQSQSFLVFIGRLGDAEKDVLRILIKHNSAMAIRTIRNYMVFEFASKNIDRLVQVYKIEVNKPYSPFRTKEFVDNSNSPESRLKLYQALAPDAMVIAAGYSPLSISEKVVVLEKALRDKLKISVYTWGSINKAIRLLKKDTMIEKRRGEIPGQKRGVLYFVAPQLYLLWQQEYDKLRDKTNKSLAEKFWFE